MVLGHDLSKGQRTQDVRISEDVSFDTMLLNRFTLKGLKKSGFLKPSPIQLHGIPLGKCGFDLLLEAKSGTGKTAVFTVIALEKLELNKGVQTIILAPTREIASQISDVITEIGSTLKGLNVAVVMGGLPVKDDIEKFKENVHIVVGSPGRLRHLIQDKHVDVSSVRLFVLDEADKLMENSFKPDINYIFSCLPKQKQVIMSSATYPDETKLFISKYVQKAQHICPDSNSILQGIAQKVTIVPHHSNIVKQTKHRYDELKKILNGKQFKQCLIFCNYQVRVGELHKMLSRDKWPAEQLYGQQDQTDRLDALKTLQEYKCRILISTDLAARGIDASNVDVVINFEPPFEWQTYLHRIGRAGRYGSYGTAISILSEGKEKMKFKEILGLTNMAFDIRTFWNDEPFNLSLTIIDDSHEENTAPVSDYPKIETLNEDKNDLLWEVLTTDMAEENDVNRQEISNFNALCASFKKSCESSIESFSELMHSFAMKHNDTDKNLGSYKYKQVKVAKLPIDNLNYWFGADGKNISNKLANETEPKIEINKINGDSVNEKEPVYTENDIHLAEHIVMEETKLPPNRNDSITENNIHDQNIQMGLDKIDQQERVKLKQDKSRFVKQSSEAEFCPTKQALIDAGLPTAFGKAKNINNYTPKSRNSYDSNNNNEIKKSDQHKVQHRLISSQQNDNKIIKNILPHRSANTDKENCSSDTNEERVESDYSTSSNDKWATNKSRNNHSIRNAPSFCNNTYKCHQKYSKRGNKHQVQNRGRQFDHWYNQLKCQMQYIQYALYIEELRKL